MVLPFVESFGRLVSQIVDSGSFFYAVSVCFLEVALRLKPFIFCTKCMHTMLAVFDGYIAYIPHGTRPSIG